MEQRKCEFLDIDVANPIHPARPQSAKHLCDKRDLSYWRLRVNNEEVKRWMCWYRYSSSTERPSCRYFIKHARNGIGDVYYLQQVPQRIEFIVVTQKELVMLERKMSLHIVLWLLFSALFSNPSIACLVLHLITLE